MRKISIKDVAKDVGVSITTVSRALNGYSDVSEKTKKKILEAVERLNYAPDINARSLGGKADTTIALLTSELREKDENGFVYGLIYGLFQQCSEQGCEFMLLVTNKAKQEKLSFLQLCKKKNLSGVVVSGLGTDDSYYHEVLSSNIPCALVDMRVEAKNKCSITIDNVHAAKEAVEHLIRLGHRKIGMINGSETAEVCAERYKGYASALKEAGIPVCQEYVCHCDFIEETAFEKTRKLLARHPEITAFFCASDMMAIGVVRAAEAMGMRVPEDISVVGFDDISIAGYMCKGITTIRQSPAAMGLAGGEAVWRMLKDEPVGTEIILPHELIIRETTAKARNGGV
ncbi:MAG: LacI family transcriptional regulator [Hungatella sp.]|jgi:LacI family transcriptional regulator|nr:LacI family transcriptional regulator [Hungatella sp.]